MNTRNYFYVIPLVMLEIIIQLLFFWLAPSNACRWVVYAFLTAVSAAHLTLVFILGCKKGARRSVPSILCGTLILMFLIATGIFMLSTNATFRNAMFLMLIISILYAAAMSLMVFSIEPDEDAPQTPTMTRTQGGNQTYYHSTVPMPPKTARNGWNAPEMPTHSYTTRRDGNQTPPLPIK